MRPCPIRLLSALSLPLLGLAALAAAQDVTKSPEKLAQEDIVRLGYNLDGKDVAERAQKIVKDHDSCDISSVFKMGPRGLGIGELTKAGHRNSVERLVQDYTRKAPPQAELEKYQPDLIRTARVLQAMAELAPYRGPLVTSEKNLPQWAKVSAEFKVTTKGFRDAVESRDPERVRKAAIALNGTCCSCHELRDN
jgi:hypothetical protein